MERAKFENNIEEFKGVISCVLENPAGGLIVDVRDISRKNDNSREFILSAEDLDKFGLHVKLSKGMGVIARYSKDGKIINFKLLLH